MSANVTETDTFSTNVPTPVMGDKFTYPATVTDALGKLASRTRHLLNTLNNNFGGGESFGVDDVSAGLEDVFVPPLGRHNAFRTAVQHLLSNIGYVRESVWGVTGVAGSAMDIPLVPTAESDGGALQGIPGDYWSPSAASDIVKWAQLQTPTAAPRLWFTIPGLPPAGTITDFSFRVQGGTGHAGTLPGTLPAMTLFRRLTGSAPVSVMSKTDPAATAAAYELEHAVFSDPFEEALQPDCCYFFRFEGEAGTNKQDDLKLVSINITIGPP